jgi:hypothetical protein
VGTKNQQIQSIFTSKGPLAQSLVKTSIYLNAMELDDVLL